MSETTFLDRRVTLHGGDCLAILKTLPDASVDSVVTDPPYHLTSIVKRFGGANAAPAKSKQTGAFARSSRGFMGKTWDGGDIAFQVELWAEVLRVLKPGGHLVAFSGTRTYHRMAVAIEDAGFEIRDQLAWTYGSGFPKSHDVSKAIDKAAGVEREVVGPNRFAHLNGKANLNVFGAASRPDESAAATDAARHWQGWGSALKPAWEPICLARKPLDGTIAANVLAHGVGALNIDGCRVAHVTVNGGNLADNPHLRGSKLRAAPVATQFGREGDQTPLTAPLGRFPANLIHDGSPEVLAAFPDAPGQQREVNDTFASKTGTAVYGDYGPRPTVLPRDKGGSAARFFQQCSFQEDEWNARYVQGASFAAPPSDSTETPAAADPPATRNSASSRPASPPNRASTEGSPRSTQSPSNASADQPASTGITPTTPSPTANPAIGANTSLGGEGRAEDVSGPVSGTRFHYSSKADADDRIGSKHPTVKPVDLMQWLVRLVTPKGGTVLDLFAGTGTTGEAAFREGCHAILIEREEEYRADIARRMELALAGPDERKRRIAAIKSAPDLTGTMFAEAAE